MKKNNGISESIKFADFVVIQDGVKVGERTRICNFVNLCGCEIGQDCMIGAFVEIQKNVII